MKSIAIKSKTNQEIGTKNLPFHFQEEVREDLIQRAVLAEQSSQRQPYGASPEAGKRSSAELSRRRRKYRGSYGFGISRVPRKILSRRGTRMHWVGAFAPGTVGGRRAHPPKSEKKWEQEINKKEWKKALRSAISSTIELEYVTKRGHNVPEGYPFVLESSYEDIEKTKNIHNVLTKIGLSPELERSSQKKVRAGKGKARGRKYKKKKGPLIVVGKDCSLLKAGKNLPGVEIVLVQNLSVSNLAPGCHPGRLTFFTESALNKLEKENLFK